jgi:hypothetical protein
MGKRTLTALQFAEEYAARSGVDLKTLADANQVVCSCDDECDWPTCKGSVMESENYIENCRKGSIPLPKEIHFVKDMITG